MTTNKGWVFTYHALSWLAPFVQTSARNENIPLATSVFFSQVSPLFPLLLISSMTTHSSAISNVVHQVFITYNVDTDSCAFHSCIEAFIREWMLLSYKTCCIIEFKPVDIAFIQFWLTWGNSLLEDFYLFSEPLWIHLTIRSQSIFQLIGINNPSSCLPSPYNSPKLADSLDVICTINPLFTLGQIQSHVGEKLV